MSKAAYFMPAGAYGDRLDDCVRSTPRKKGRLAF